MARDISGIWYLLHSADAFVYHYTSANVLVDFILPKEEIRFSSFDRLNDPYEFKKLDLVWQARGAFDEKFTPTKQREFADIIRRDVRVACFSSDAVGSEFSKLSGSAKMAEGPYQRGHSLAQMWAHYGQNHAGACLVFDRARLAQAFTRGLALGMRISHNRVNYRNWPAGIISDQLPPGFRVDYDEWRLVGSEELAKRHILRHSGDILFSKTLAWASEQEYRFLLWGKAAEYVHLSYGDALVGILLGEAFPKECATAVGRYTLNSDIAVATMDWLNGFPQPRPTHPRLLLA